MKSLADRFWIKVDKNGPVHPVMRTRCWLWTGASAGSGEPYGYIWSGEGNRLERAHRVSWELHNGLIPEGQLALHHCDTSLCVRPDHLFLGSYQVNAIDMVEKNRHGRYNAKKTECKHGHPFDAENTILVPGGRQCRACKNESKRRRREVRP